MVRLRRLFVLPLLLASLAGWTAYAVHTLVPDAGAVNAFFETRLYYGLLFAAVALCGLRALSVARIEQLGRLSAPASVRSLLPTSTGRSC